MTSIFDENGKNIPCTVIQAGPCVVTQVRTEEVDGYSALQLGFDDKAEKRANKAEMGHVKKAGASPKKKVVEFRDFEGEFKLGDTIGVDLFQEGEFVDVVGLLGRIGIVDIIEIDVHDAHGIGVTGPGGRGSCHAQGIAPELLIVTFGKGVGVSGAAVLCSDSVADYLLQFARHLIYSTSMPPTQAVALREAREESGLAEFESVGPGIFDLDIHTIPKRRNEPEHFHYDVRYAFWHRGDGKYEVTEESHDLAWVDLEDLPNYTQEPDMARMAAKWKEQSHD